MEIEKILQQYKKNYSRIFESIYPSKNSTGFTERNLSVNFAKAYEQIHPNAFTWYEFQFGEKNNLHYDAIIINPEGKELIIIESKRFSNVSNKVKEVGEDVERIRDFNTKYFKDFLDRIPNLNEYSVVGVILADVWTETPPKIAIKTAFEKAYFAQVHVKNFAIAQNSEICNYKHFCLDFTGVKVPAVRKKNTIPTNYYLLGMIWDVKRK